MQAVNLKPQIAILVPVQPVGDQQHHRALAKHPPRPVTVEALQRTGNAGAAGPVIDTGRHRAQGGIRVAVLHLAGHIGQARAKEKGMNCPAPLRQRMGKTQQHS